MLARDIVRVHHLNCATLCPIGGRLVSGTSDPARLICHCLLIETSDGLVLVDSGFGTTDCTRPETFDAALRTFGRPCFSLEETAKTQIEGLGFKVADVKHIVPTHLDLDHAGGISDFPEATVHIFRPEYAAAMDPQTLIETRRYVPRHFAHGPKWKIYDVEGAPWFGFETVRNLEGLPPEILLVPLVGHTRGHVAVAVDAGDRWLMHCGDAYYHRNEMASPPGCPGGLRIFQRIAAVDDRKRRQNQRRLRELKAKEPDRVHLFSAHDPKELEAFAP